MKQVSFSELVGKTLVYVLKYSDKIIFECEDGSIYQQSHEQDCCEQVTIEDVCGDLNNLIGTPILKAECETSDKNPRGMNKQVSDPDSGFQWTFYNLWTVKGSVTIRWYGESTYYSVDVDMFQIEKKDIQ